MTDTRTDADILVADCEDVIRDIAGHVIAQVAARKSHPTYGVTKRMVTESIARLDGAIGLYMVLAGQAMHSGVPLLATFADGRTTARVESARAAARDI